MTAKAKTKAAAKPKARDAEWWEFEPTIPKREPTRATLTLQGGKEAKNFAEVLKQVVDCTCRSDGGRPVLECIQMQTAKGLRLVAADGFRLAIAKYRPGLTHDDKASPILARSALFHRDRVLEIAKVIGGTSATGRATLEVKRDGLKRTLYAVNDKGLSARAPELPGDFPNWLELVPTEKAAAPGGLERKVSPVGGPFLQGHHLRGRWASPNPSLGRHHTRPLRRHQ